MQREGLRDGISQHGNGDTKAVRWVSMRAVRTRKQATLASASGAVATRHQLSMLGALNVTLQATERCASCWPAWAPHSDFKAASQKWLS